MTTKALDDKDLQRYYDELFTTFSTPGWASLMETVDVLIKNTEDIRRVVDEKALYFRQGELSNLEWLKGLQAMHEFSYRQLLQDDEPDGVEKPGIATVIA